MNGLATSKVYYPTFSKVIRSDSSVVTDETSKADELQKAKVLRIF